jgi:hypothetical protein
MPELVVPAGAGRLPGRGQVVAVCSSAGARSPLPRWCYVAGCTCATVLMALASGTVKVTVLAGVLVTAPS